jgi:hypothetical protein
MFECLPEGTTTAPLKQQIKKAPDQGAFFISAFRLVIICLVAA